MACIISYLFNNKKKMKVGSAVIFDYFQLLLSNAVVYQNCKKNFI